MTLDQWCTESGAASFEFNEAVGVVGYIGPEWRPILWHVSDYKVSSIAGGVIWLTPSPPSPTCPAEGHKQR